MSSSRIDWDSPLMGWVIIALLIAAAIAVGLILT
jgi:hypothetical protein